MRSSLVLLACVLACAQRASAPAAASAAVPATASDASAARIILPDKSVIAVEVASEDETRAQGLMYRDHLADDRGMIFLFPEAGEYPFWMKNTLIPLDMIWIDKEHRIVHIAHDVPPCKADPCPNYPPHAQASSVLELAAGVAAKHHLAEGNVLRFEGMDNAIVR
ncbi:MAG: uncharacterized protein QOC81_3843 [Thermoanaerobaculia bacterium]|jgi:uncharacterized membrane protein (UPF0127 family)|nr:uncharacterized protein [Thermoanaerobaculia bacterium]